MEKGYRKYLSHGDNLRRGIKAEDEAKDILLGKKFEDIRFVNQIYDYEATKNGQIFLIEVKSSYRDYNISVKKKQREAIIEMAKIRNAIPIVLIKNMKTFGWRFRFLNEVSLDVQNQFPFIFRKNYSHFTYSDKTFYLTILNYIGNGLNQQQMAEKFQTLKQNLYYYFRNLKELGLIKKVGYGTWELVYPYSFCVQVITDAFETAIAKSEATTDIPTDKETYKTYYAPHNYAIKAPILVDNPNVHLPIQKDEGRGGSTHREYIDFDDAKVERTTKNLIAYLKKGIERFVEKPNDIDVIKDEIEKLLKARLNEVAIAYKIQIGEFTVSRKEIKIKDPLVDKLPRELRFKDTVGKKVYPDNIELYNEYYAKNWIKNRALVDVAPEIAIRLDSFTGATDELTRQIQLHLEVENKINKLLDEEKIAILELKDAAKSIKETSFSYVLGNFVKKIKSWFE